MRRRNKPKQSGAPIRPLKEAERLARENPHALQSAAGLWAARVLGCAGRCSECRESTAASALSKGQRAGQTARLSAQDRHALCRSEDPARFLAYDHQGGLVSTIYMIPIKDLDGHNTIPDLSAPGGRVDHVSLYYNAGHPGVPEPHYHIVLWHVPKAEEQLVAK